MKTFSLLCLLLGLTDATAFFNFGNLLFSVGLCKSPGKRCHVVCHGPLSHGVKNYCDNQCTGRRQLSDSDGFCYTSGACIGMSGSYYAECMAGADSDGSSSGGDGGGNVDAAESSVSGGGGANGTQSIPTPSRRLSWLPILIGAIVLTMIAIVATRIRRKKKANPELQAALDTEEDLHGGVAKRMERIESGRPVNPLRRAGTETSFVPSGANAAGDGVETPYALA